MERKIGEIFEYNGGWYQCIESDSCGECSLRMTECGSGTKSNLADEVFGECSKIRRSDSKHVIFKKLERVGEPFFVNIQGNNILQQRYNLYEPTVALEGYWYRIDGNFINIEIKQNKEDMEEKKLNLKPFDIQKAREGKPVCTRDGRKVRIICFDGKGDQPIIALVEAKGNKDALIEKVERYFINGHSVFEVRETNNDLVMLPEKKEGWVNVYREESNNNERLIEQTIYKTRKDAFEHACPQGYITTTKINWEE